MAVAGPLLVSERSAAVALTTTESAFAALFASLVSAIAFDGSTTAVPPARGFMNVPAAVGVALKTMSKEEGFASMTVPELATQARSKLPLMAQPIVPLVPIALTIAGVPYVRFAFGRLSA